VSRWFRHFNFGFRYTNGGALSNSLTAIPEYDAALRRRGIVLCALGLFGLLLMIIASILSYDFGPDPKPDYDYMLQPEHAGIYYSYHSIKILNIINTLICIGLLIDYYVTYAKYKRDQRGFSGTFAAFVHSSIKFKFFGELFVLLYTPVTPILLLDQFTSLGGFSDKLGVIMFFRIYLIVRVVRDCSELYLKRDEIKSHPKLKDSPELFGWDPSFRSLIFNYPFQTFIVGNMVLILVFTFVIWVLERETNVQGKYFFDTVWSTAVTITNVGYGDRVSNTFLGRIMALIVGNFGALMMKALFCIVLVHAEVTPIQKSIQDVLEKDELTVMRLEHAVRVLQLRWMRRKGKCTHTYFMDKTIKAVRKLRKYSAKLTFKKPSEYIMMLQLHWKNEELRQKINVTTFKVNNLAKRLQTLIKNKSKQT
jgi:hypothetical protein